MAQWQRICLPMQEMQETWVWFLGGEDPLEEKMATESQSLDGIIPRTEEPNGLQSMRLQRLDTTKHSLLGIKSDTLDLPLMALPGRTPLLSGVWPLCSNTCNELSVESLEESIPLGLIAPSCHSCHLCFYLFDGSRFPQSFTTVCICCYLLDTIKRAGLIAAPCLTKEVLNKCWKVATPACLFRLLGDTAVGERVGNWGPCSTAVFGEWTADIDLAHPAGVALGRDGGAMGLHVPRGVGTIVEEVSKDSQAQNSEGTAEVTPWLMGISAPDACFHKWHSFHDSLFCFALEVFLNENESSFLTHTDIRQQVMFLLGSQSHSVVSAALS